MYAKNDRCNIFEQVESLIGNKMSKFSDKSATIEIPPRSKNIHLSLAKVDLVAAQGNITLTFPKRMIVREQNL